MWPTVWPDPGPRSPLSPWARTPHIVDHLAHGPAQSTIWPTVRHNLVGHTLRRATLPFFSPPHMRNSLHHSGPAQTLPAAQEQVANGGNLVGSSRDLAPGARAVELVSYDDGEGSGRVLVSEGNQRRRKQLIVVFKPKKKRACVSLRAPVRRTKTTCPSSLMRGSATPWHCGGP